ncbi:hypothetical protein BDW74DRAFT_143711 [Aspergillus multicolor]|uniref:uncharacterized protein n=1 Tax=Aspergillus multicolor TaxID=41759 RepID=UPI003CCD02EF
MMVRRVDGWLRVLNSSDARVGAIPRHRWDSLDDCAATTPSMNHNKTKQREWV